MTTLTKPAPKTPYYLRVGAQYLTTGQIAKMTDVAPRTVAKWCNSGELVSHRVAMSADRRIAPRDLVDFLERYGMPIPAEMRADADAVLAVGMLAADVDTLRSTLQAAGIAVKAVASSFTAGVMLGTLRPRLIVVDDRVLGSIEAGIIERHVASVIGPQVLRVRECHGEIGVAVLAALAGGGA